MLICIYVLFFSCVFRNSYLKKRDFADDGVVDVYSDVQAHFIWQLSQQLLLIWKADSKTYSMTERSDTDQIRMNMRARCSPYPACLVIARCSCTRF